MENGLKYVGDLLDSLKSGFLTQTDYESIGFNIFKALGIEAKEVLTCRFLGAILEPNGAHDLKTEPLRLFLKTVLNVNDTAAEIKDASVVLEEVIKDNRRVDIVIRNRGKVYPIEVKIDAGDQDSQLEDYYNYYFENDLSQKIYYLTPTGRNPSQRSKGGLNDSPGGNVVTLSFEKDIDDWLSEVCRIKNIRSDISGIIEQYREVIKDMCATKNNIKIVLDSLDWENGEFKLTDKTKALIELLALNGDKNGDLQKELQKKYLKKHLLFDKSRYCYCDEEPSEEEKRLLGFSAYSLLYIAGNNDPAKPIACICIETNLYLGCKKHGLSSKHKWDAETWTYLHPDGTGKKFQLNDCRNMLKYEKNIDIDGLLSNISDEEV